MRTRGKIRKLLFSLLLGVLLGSTLFGAITATYSPASYLNFKRGDEVSRLPATPLGTFSSDRLVAYLGTIIITRDGGDAYYRPVLVNYDNAAAIYVRGPLSGWGGGIHDTQFYVYAKNTMRSEAHPLWLAQSEANLYNDDWNLNPQITDNPFIVDLFLVSHHPASLYIEDESYTLPQGALGSFNVKVSIDSNHSNQEFVPVNGQSIPPDGTPPADPIPIPEAGSGAPIPEIPYGDDPLPIMFQINIIENSPFVLTQAYNNDVKVATAELIVVNGEEGQTYSVEIKFTNPQNSNTFSLRPKDKPNGYAIPYRLKFGSINNVVGNTLYDWDSLSPVGVNSKDIKIYDISKTVVDNAPAGIFEDTILVEIFSTY